MLEVAFRLADSSGKSWHYPLWCASLILKGNQ